MSTDQVDGFTVQWQILPDGAREVYAIPRDVRCTQWIVTPITGAGPGKPETISAADLAPTEEVALLLWHERSGHTDEVEEIVARIGARYRAAREQPTAVDPWIPQQREAGEAS